MTDYAVFGLLVGLAAFAAFVGLRRRRAERLGGDRAATFPYAGDGSAGFTGTHGSGHARLESSVDAGAGSDAGGGFDAGGDSDVGGGSDGGGGFEAGGGSDH